MGTDILHLRVKKDYAQQLLELLIKDDAIEDVDLQTWELSEAQKKALDVEMDLIANNPNYLIKWDDAKQRFRK